MGVSKNNGTPKSSILIGISIINHPFWGTSIFGNTHIIWLVKLQRLLYFHPETWERLDFHFDLRIFFKWVGSTANLVIYVSPSNFIVIDIDWWDIQCWKFPPCHGDEFFDLRMCHFFERGRCLKANESLCETVGGRMQESGLMPRNPRYGFRSHR